MSDTSKKRRSWVPIALVISLGVNLLGAGIIAGGAFKGSSKTMQQAGGQIGMRQLVRALPQEKRTALRDTYKQNRGDMRPRREEMNQSMQQIRKAIRAVPFDRTELETAFEKRNLLQRSAVSVGRKSIIDIIESMSNDERAEYAEKMGKKSKRPKKQ